jgi:hypothetical protein
MPQFHLQGYLVQALDLEDAKKVLEIFLNDANERVILIQKGSESILIKIDDTPTRIFTRYKKSITYCGEVKVGSGERLLEAAIESVQVSNTEAAKLSAAVKKVNQIKRHSLEKKDIDQFESNVPSVARALYSKVMLQIGATTDAYKLEIIEGLVEIQIKPEHWIPILVWFRDKVLQSEDGADLVNKQSFFQLRKAFVTTARRMAKNDVRHGNTMKSVMSDGRSGIDWLKYAENQTGS